MHNNNNNKKNDDKKSECSDESGKWNDDNDDDDGGGGRKKQQQHLVCHSCKMNLKNYKSVDVDAKKLCISCFEMEFANRCYACKKRIRIDQMEMNFKDFYWHDYCFNCSLCGASLVNRCFAFNDGLLICPPCYEKEMNLECFRCKEKFKDGQRVFEFDKSHWHEECLRCVRCDYPISTSPFIQLPQSGDFMCLECYEQMHVKLCHKCGKAIKSEGVECFDTHVQWHHDCFSCSVCGKHLLDSSTSAGKGDYACKDKELFCGDCYVKKYFRKCARCYHDIEGTKHMKFINFENLNWHARCFSCYRCNVSLVDRGFVILADDILCPGCARSKIN
ncbi:hypothetical protein HELRODRAFT_76167 [Helobdella robusta]|uniref:LIM zinc-binding domain-containing protein n=1 Tax=Helobdella robusta TaxID=6412 RepID=T1G2G1_HELRO|nr:hypothetical protein HELRODRAFT_76167 [Helobdella robusta]ESO07587.1 hypothetical protein HELRODRAFT_76167 [Helobdella robusta]